MSDIRFPNNAPNPFDKAQHIFTAVRQLVGEEAANDMTFADAEQLYNTLPKDFHRMISSNGLVIPEKAPESPSHTISNWPDVSNWLG